MALPQPNDNSPLRRRRANPYIARIRLSLRRPEQPGHTRSSHRSPGANTMAGKTPQKSAKVAKKADAKSSDDLSVSERIDKKIADLGDWRGERLAEICKLIHEVDPEVVEEWKWMGSPRLVAQRDVRRRQRPQGQGETHLLPGSPAP